VSGVQLPLWEKLSQCTTGQLSLAIPPWVNAMSTSQRVGMLCGWGVKAGMVHEWLSKMNTVNQMHQFYYYQTLSFDWLRL